MRDWKSESLLSYCGLTKFCGKMRLISPESMIKNLSNSLHLNFTLFVYIVLHVTGWRHIIFYIVSSKMKLYFIHTIYNRIQYIIYKFHSRRQYIFLRNNFTSILPYSPVDMQRRYIDLIVVLLIHEIYMSAYEFSERYIVSHFGKLCYVLSSLVT